MSNKSVLIVEDEQKIRKALATALQRAGYDVIEAPDGLEGLDQVLKHRPNLVLLDLVMPKMDGFTMLTKLREHDSAEDLPVIILTNSVSEQSALGELADTTQGYFIKANISLKEITEAVKKLIDND